MIDLRHVNRDDDGVLRATSYTVRTCDCGNIHFDLHGFDGVVFASASFDPQNAPALAAKLAGNAPLVRNPARGGAQAMREGLRDIVSGWTLINSFDELTDRIERAAAWTKANGPLHPDEEATVRLMIESQVARGIARGDFEPFLPADPDYFAQEGD